MIKNKILFITILLVVILSLIVPAKAADKEKEDGKFSGSIMVGYRGVDVDGVESKYKEDYNLDSGPRLFKLKFHFQPTGNLKKFFDRVDLTLHNFGGEPFETFDFSMAKYGTYQFKYQRRKSDYFYNDIFEGHDFHTFDFERISDSLFFKIWLHKYSRLYFSFDRYTKKGSSTTSFDISRDEFEFDQPIDESSKEITIGVDLGLKGFTLLLEEKIRDYANDYHYFLPGASQGEDPGDLSALYYYFFNQPYDYRSFTHTGRISARPMDNLLIKAAAQIGTQDVRLSYSENHAGVSYLGSGFTATYDGEGEFERDLQLYDFDVSYLFSSKVAFTGAVRYHKLEQNGSFDAYGAEVPHAMDYDTLGVEGGLQYQPNGKVAVTAGFRSESRDLTYEHEGEPHSETTKRTGLFGNLMLNLHKKIRLTGDYQFGDYKDPYTPISPSTFHRARFTARYKCGNYYLNGTYQYQLSENDINDGWKTERSQLGLRTGYHHKKVKLNLGYGLIYAKNEGDRNFVFYGRPATWNILYEGRTHMVDAYLKLFVAEKVTLGGYANYYKTDGTWEVERLILRPFLEVTFDGGFLGQVAYRYIDFKENINHLNDYDANIFELSFGYRW
ncbi:MAG: hypothetical protein GY940_16885 [bacterium]|nr:hypothetical protein [bacterium]